MTFDEWFKEENWGPVYGRDGEFHYGASVVWDYKQAEVDAALKQRDSFIKAHHIAMNDVCNLKAEIDALQRKLKLIEALRDSQFEQLQVVTQQRDSAQVSNIELQKRIDELEAKREGFKLAPKKCTNNMAHAAKSVDARLSAFKYGDVWDAMLSAVEVQND